MRVGIGYDIHRLAVGRKLMLGGVEVDSTKGLVGHSDADVVIHALIDALLGAAGIGDIGEYFPDSDKGYIDISSKILLANVLDMIRKENFNIINVDMIIVLEAPKLSTYKTQIKTSLAELLGISPAAINVKAKTNEKMGEIGMGRAIEAQVVCLLEKVKEK